MTVASPRLLRPVPARAHTEQSGNVLRLATIEQAKRDGSWSAYDRIEELAMPADLRKALAHDAAAKTHFAAFPPSSKKNIYWWIASAKRSETRSKRIEQTVELARDNRKANHYRQ